MRLLPTLTAVLILGTPLPAADVMTVTVPDAPRTWERLKAGFPGQIARLPAVGRLWEQGEQLAPEVMAALRPPVDAPLPQAVQIRLVLVEGQSEPQFAMRLRFPGTAAEAERIWGAWWTGLGNVPGQNTELPPLTRDGDDLVLASGPVVPAWQPVAETTADVVTHRDLAQVVTQLPEAVAAAVHGLALGGMQGSTTIDAEGFRESLRAVGIFPPMTGLDRSALQGLPTDALLGLAIALDGPGWRAWLRKLGPQAQHIDDGLARLDAQWRADGLPALSDLLFAMNGTAWLVVLPSAPFPTVTIGVPATPALDAVFTAVLAKTGVDATDIRRTAVAVRLPQSNLPIPIMARRGATHWVLSTDPLRIDPLADRQGEPFAWESFAALMPDAQSGGVLWSDNQQFLRTVAGLMGMGAGNLPPAGREPMRQMAAFCAEASRIIPPTRFAWRSGETGFHFEGRNATVGLSQTSVLAGLLLPAVNMVRQRAHQTSVANNIKQLVTGTVAYSIDFDGEMPPDLATLIRHCAMPEQLLRSRRAPADLQQPHFCYIRTSGEPASYQPVIIENPACTGGREMVVGRADGSVAIVRGADAARLWAEAQRLAALPKAQESGIELSDWAAVQEIISR